VPLIGSPYWATTTRSDVAPTTVACGDVVVQVTAVVTFVHVYQLVPSTWALMVEPATGAVSSVNVTESTFCGLVPFKT
jgi:hypothetical protein